MEGVGEFLEDIQKRGLARGHLLGLLLHILIGRHNPRGRHRDRNRTDLARRGSGDEARRAGAGRSGNRPRPASLPPRRQRFWYQAIAAASVGSAEAAIARPRRAI